MKRIIASVLTIAVASVVMVLGNVAPAQASSATVCIEYQNGGNIQTCIRPIWLKQADGRITLTQINMSTPKGCSRLESWERYQTMEMQFPGVYGRSFSFGPQGCNASYSLYESTSGRADAARFDFYTHARVNLGPDYQLFWSLALRANGSVAVLDSWRNCLCGV